LNVWGRIAFLAALAMFFISCHAKANEQPSKPKAPVEKAMPADPLKELNLAIPDDKEQPRKCEHSCKIDLNS
jgi:hypothetical protein